MHGDCNDDCDNEYLNEMETNLHSESERSTQQQRGDGHRHDPASDETNDQHEALLRSLVRQMKINQVDIGNQNEALIEAIEKSELRLRKYTVMYDLAPTAYLTLASSGHIIEMNKAGASLLNANSDSLPGQPFEHYLDLNSRDEYTRFTRALITGEPTVPCQVNLRLERDCIKNVLLTGYFNEIEKTWLLNLLDISERFKYEQLLQQTLSFTESILNSIHNGILVVDNKGKVMKTNENFARMWQIPGEILESADDQMLLKFVMSQLEDPQEFMQKVASLYNTPFTESFDLIRFKDKRVFERISKPVFDNAQPVGRVWSFLDVTTKVNHEAEISQKNEALQRINAEKDKFFSIIAHDLKSPFNVFLGVTELISEDARDLSREQISKLTASLHGSAQKLYHLLENLLEWSQMQRGKIPFEPKKLSLEPFLSDCLSTSIEMADKKNIEVTISVPPDAKVVADELMLASVLRNLTTNAVKFTPVGGHISIVAESIEDQKIRIMVRDSGIGMDKQLINGLFRLDENTNRVGTEGEPSTGLGLMLCKGFVEKHHGKIWVESETNKGSSFYLTLSDQKHCTT